ncbi:unnamed protein product, partial [Ectocarpus sp. 4 AP-2014]
MPCSLERRERSKVLSAGRRRGRGGGGTRVVNNLSTGRRRGRRRGRGSISFCSTGIRRSGRRRGLRRRSGRDIRGDECRFQVTQHLVRRVRPSSVKEGLFLLSRGIRQRK